MLKPSKLRLYREKFPQKQGKPIYIEHWVAMFDTARGNGEYYVIFMPEVKPYQDGIIINGLYLEDLNGDDFFCCEMWTALVGLTFDEFKECAEVIESTFNPNRPDGNQIIL